MRYDITLYKKNKTGAMIEKEKESHILNKMWHD